MKQFIHIILLSLSLVARPLFAEDSVFVTIPSKGVLLYESPATTSPIVRRVFAGEVLKVVGKVKAEQGDLWGKVYISPSQFGYIQNIHLAGVGTIEQKVWKPQEVTRTQLPFSFAAKGTGEFFGPGLQFRYLPFTRFGVTVGGGSILDQGKSRGFSVAYGITCILAMANFSPFIETGSSTLTINDDNSSLKISTFYVNAGVEWILRSGYFIGAGISYIRSYNIQVGYDYSYAKSSNGSISVGDYGSFSGLSGSESLERLNPLFIAGYSF